MAPEPADGARPQRERAGDIRLLAREADAQERGERHECAAPRDGIDSPGDKGRGHDSDDVSDVHAIHDDRLTDASEDGYFHLKGYTGFFVPYSGGHTVSCLPFWICSTSIWCLFWFV